VSTWVNHIRWLSIEQERATKGMTRAGGEKLTNSLHEEENLRRTAMSVDWGGKKKRVRLLTFPLGTVSWDEGALRGGPFFQRGKRVGGSSQTSSYQIPTG